MMMLSRRLWGLGVMEGFGCAVDVMGRYMASPRASD